MWCRLDLKSAPSFIAGIFDLSLVERQSHFQDDQSENGHFIPCATKSSPRCLFLRMGELKKPRWPFGLLEISFLIFLIGFITFFVIQTQTQRPRWRTSPANACINNLRQFDAGANEFALENHKTNGEAIHFPDDLIPYIKLTSAGKIPSCPMGGVYSIKRVGDLPTCSLGTTVTPAHVLR
jgi:hypothetical protein